MFSEATHAVLEEVEKLRRIVEEFSRFARLPQPAMSVQDLNEVVRGAVALYAGPDRVTLALDEALSPFRFDPDQLHRVVVNLVQNALEASGPESPVRVETRRNADDQVLLSIIDQGSGIDPDHHDDLFTPYWTTKAQGTGLGLAIVARIVEEHGGSIQAQPGPDGRGTCFRITLPHRT